MANQTLYIVWASENEMGMMTVMKGIYTVKADAERAAKGCSAWGADGKVQIVTLKNGRWLPKLPR